MNPLPLSSSAPHAGPADCWNRIGIRGDRSCPELAKVDHCHNCPVFASAGRQFLDAPSPAGYLEEWTDRLRSKVADDDPDWESVLVFRLGEEWLALPVAVLVEVTTPRPVHRVPHPQHRGPGALLAGLVNIRGELHLCVHLDRLLGVGPAEGPPPLVAVAERKARLLVVRREGERWVFRVDEVDQVARFPASALVAVPATVARAASRLTRGLFRRHDRSIGYLDEARLFQTLRARMR